MLLNYSKRRFVLCLTLCHFVLVFFSPFSIAITSLGEEGANLSAFRTFVRFVLVWICQFPLPLSVWEELRFVIVALPGLFSYLFLHNCIISLHMLSEQMTHFLTLQIWREINESSCKESLFISLKFVIFSCLKGKFFFLIRFSK